MTTNLERLNHRPGGSRIADAGPAVARMDAAVAYAPMVPGATRIPSWDSFRAAAVRIVEVLFEWQDRARQRRHLETFDEHLLKDLGMSRADVEREASKPFWRL